MTRTGNQQWTVEDIGDQRGKTAIITGANSGIGFEAARALAAHGATIMLACRDQAKARDAAGRIASAATGDLASLASVREAAAQIRSRHTRLDLLINNAGLMMPPSGRTEDGFELQIGTNHLGHFALTGLLLATPRSRVVTVSSFAPPTSSPAQANDPSPPDDAEQARGERRPT